MQLPNFDLVTEMEDKEVKGCYCLMDGKSFNVVDCSSCKEKLSHEKHMFKWLMVLAIVGISLLAIGGTVMTIFGVV